MIPQFAVIQSQLPSLQAGHFGRKGTRPFDHFEFNLRECLIGHSLFLAPQCLFEFHYRNLLRSPRHEQSS